MRALRTICALFVLLTVSFSVTAQRPKVEPTVEHFVITGTKPVGEILYRLFEKTRARYELEDAMTWEDIGGYLDLTAQRGQYEYPRGTRMPIILNFLCDSAEPKLDWQLEKGVYRLSRIPDIKGIIELARGELAAIRTLNFSRDGQMIACGDDKQNIVIWGMNGKPIQQFKGVLGSNAFSPEGSLFGYGSSASLVLYDINKRKTVFKKAAHTSPLVALAFSEDGSSVVTSGQDNVVRVTTLTKTPSKVKFLREYQCPTPKAIFIPSIHPNGKTVAGILQRDPFNPNADTHPQRNQLLLWKVGGRARFEKPEAGEMGRWKAAAFSPDGKTLVALNLNRKLYLFDGETLNRTQNPIDIQSDWKGEIGRLRYDTIAVTFTNDSRTILVSGFNNRVFAYDRETGAPSKEFNRVFPASDFSAMAFSRDGRYFATGQDTWWNSPDKVKVWDLERGTVFNFNLIDATTTSVAFCPGKPGVVATAGSNVLIWDFARGKRPISVEGTSPIIFSPDGMTLITQGKRAGEIIAWDAKNGSRIQTYKLSNSGIRQMLFSPDGRKFVIAPEAQAPFLFDYTSGKILTKLTGLSGTALTLKFCPDSRMLSAVSSSQTGIIWDTDIVPTPGQDCIVFTFSTKGAIRPDAIALGKNCFAYEKDQEVTFHEVTEQFHKMTSTGTNIIKDKGIHPLIATDSNNVNVLLMQYRDTVPTYRNKIVAYNGKTGEGNTPLIQALSDIQGLPVLTPHNVLVTTEGKTLRYYNLTTKQATAIKGSQVAEGDIVMDAEGRFGATLGGGVAALWRLGGKGRMGELLTLVTVGRDDFLAFVPNSDNSDMSNYYWASPRSVKALRMRSYGDIYPFEQFEVLLNRQDIVLRTVGLARGSQVKEIEAVYRQRLKKMEVTEEKLKATKTKDLPHVKPLKFPLVTDQRTMNFTVEAECNKENIAHLDVRVNGVPIYGAKGKALGEHVGSKIHETVSVDLRRGDNQIDVDVRNASGGRSFIQTESVRCTVLEQPAKVYALLIGVSKQPEAADPSKKPDFAELAFADKDAKDMETLLKKMQIAPPKVPSNTPQKPAAKPPVKVAKGKKVRRGVRYFPVRTYVKPTPQPKLLPIFEKVHTLVLDNEKGTRDAIKEANAFLAQAGANDLVLVFVAGHGWRDTKAPGQPYYFASYGAQIEKGDETAISFEDLEQLLDNLKAHNKLLLLDTCNSGEPDDLEAGKMPTIVEPKDAGKDQPVRHGARNGLVRIYRTRGDNADAYVETSLTDRMKEQFLDMRHGTGTNMISAATAFQAASEGGKYKNGHFTLALLEGIGEMKADMNKDRVITVSELREYVGIKVLKISEGRQKPIVLRENASNDFIIAGRPLQP